MLNKLSLGLLMMAACAVTTAAHADERDFNVATGAVIGAAIGHSTGARNGAVIGGVLGAVVGSNVNTRENARVYTQYPTQYPAQTRYETRYETRYAPRFEPAYRETVYVSAPAAPVYYESRPRYYTQQEVYVEPVHYRHPHREFYNDHYNDRPYHWHNDGWRDHDHGEDRGHER